MFSISKGIAKKFLKLLKPLRKKKAQQNCFIREK